MLKLNNDRSPMKKIGLQFFAEKDDGTVLEGNEPSPDPQPKNDPAPLNYDELFKTDKALQSFIDSKVTKAVNTAISNDRQKQLQLADEKLSESEKLKGMSDREQAEYYKSKYENAQTAMQRKSQADDLKSQTLELAKEKNIPAEIIGSMFNFETATAEDIKNKLEFLSTYEFHKQGDFESELKRQLDEKLKQKTPQTHVNNKNFGTLGDPKELEAWGL